MSRPIILLAFSNDREGSFLRNIAGEQKAIKQALAEIERRGGVKVADLTDVTAEDIFSAFRLHRDKVRIFHYGGHAAEFELIFQSGKEKKESVDGRQLASFLASQQKLELVFLNGCSTEEQRDTLAEAGIPYIITTSQQINDQTAKSFAGLFYESLASGADIPTSFREAESQLLATQGGNTRALYFDKGNHADLQDTLPWKLTETASPTGFKLKKAISRWLYVTLIAAMLAILAIAYVFLKPEPLPFPLKIQLSGMENDPAVLEGRLNLTLNKDGQAQVILEKPVNKDRTAYFNIDHIYEGGKANIIFSHPQPYSSANPDSFYVVKKNGTINLPIKLNQLATIRGYLYDFETESPLAGVQVILRPEVATQTDEFGMFTLAIPEKFQAKYQNLRFIKEGYQVEVLNELNVHTRQEVRLPLMRNQDY